MLSTLKFSHSNAVLNFRSHHIYTTQIVIEHATDDSEISPKSISSINTTWPMINSNESHQINLIFLA